MSDWNSQGVDSFGDEPLRWFAVVYGDDGLVLDFADCCFRAWDGAHECWIPCEMGLWPWSIPRIGFPDGFTADGLEHCWVCVHEARKGESEPSGLSPLVRCGLLGDILHRSDQAYTFASMDFGPALEIANRAEHLFGNRGGRELGPNLEWLLTGNRTGISAETKMQLDAARMYFAFSDSVGRVFDFDGRQFRRPEDSVNPYLTAQANSWQSNQADVLWAAGLDPSLALDVLWDCQATLYEQVRSSPSITADRAIVRQPFKHSTRFIGYPGCAVLQGSFSDLHVDVDGPQYLGFWNQVGEVFDFAKSSYLTPEAASNPCILCDLYSKTASHSVVVRFPDSVDPYSLVGSTALMHGQSTDICTLFADFKRLKGYYDQQNSWMKSRGVTEVCAPEPKDGRVYLGIYLPAESPGQTSTFFDFYGYRFERFKADFAPKPKPKRARTARQKCDPPRSCRLDADIEAKTVWLDGKGFPVPSLAAVFVRAVIESGNDYISGKQIHERYPEFDHYRVNRARDQLKKKAKDVLALIDTTGKGSRLKPEAWESRSQS